MGGAKENNPLRAVSNRLISVVRRSIDQCLLDDDAAQGMAHPYDVSVQPVSSDIIYAGEQILGKAIDGGGLKCDARRVSERPYASFVCLETAEEIGEQVLEPDDTALRMLPCLGSATSQAVYDDDTCGSSFVSCFLALLTSAREM